MSSRASFAAMIGLASLVACADDAPVPADSGMPDAVIDAAMDTALPLPVIDPPALPVLTPCPAGWREVAGEAGAPAYCAPFAAGGPEDCPSTEAHFPGGAGCEPVGDPCPTDGFAPDLPATDVVFVDADAAAAGDGSRASPLTDVAAALAVVPDGGTVAVAPGTYGPIRIDRPVSIVGACTDVIFTSTDMLPTIEVASTDATLENVRVTGSREGIGVRDGTLGLTGIVVDAIRMTALNALRARVTASRVKIADIGDTGIGLSSGSTLEIDHVVVLDAMNDSLRTSFSRATVTDAVLLRSADGQHYFASEGEGALFERVAFFGPGTLINFGATSLELRDSVIEGPPEGVDTMTGSIATFEGAALTMSRVRIERYRSLAAAVADPGGVLTMTDTIIRDTLGATSDMTGHGVELGNAAHGTIERSWIERSHGIGILVATSGTVLELRDVTIVDSLSDPFGTFGRALQIQSGAALVGSRVAVRGNHEVAVVAASTGTTVTLSHLLVEDTRERTCDCPSAGVGVGAYLEGALILDRFHIRDNALAGVQIANDGSVDLSDGVVESNPVGVNIQVPDYDVNRLTDRVYFQDNGTNLDSSDLPVPEPTVRP